MDFGDVAIQTDNEFTVILIALLKRNKEISNSQKGLVTAIANTKNTDMVFDIDPYSIIGKRIGSY